MIENGVRPVHPGEILREEFLAPLEMSASALAIRLRVPAPIIKAKKAVEIEHDITPMQA